VLRVGNRAWDRLNEQKYFDAFINLVTFFRSELSIFPENKSLGFAKKNPFSFCCFFVFFLFVFHLRIAVQCDNFS